jgi:hypothetical protein
VLLALVVAFLVFALHHLDATNGAVVLPDDPAAFPTAHDLDGAIDLKRMALFLAPLKLPVSLDRGTLHFHAKNTDAIDVEANVGTVVVATTSANITLARAVLSTTLRPRGPHFVRAKLNGHCTAGAAGAKPWFNEDIRVDLHVEDVAADFSRAHVRGTMAGPWGELVVDDQHHIHTEAAHITFQFPSLALLRPFMPKSLEAIDWGAASAAGKIELHAQLGSERPRIRQTSEIALQNLAARLPSGRLAVHSVSANARSEGKEREHHAEVGLRLAGVQWRGGSPSDQALETTVDFSAAPPRFHSALKAEGALVPSISAELQARFDRSRRELVPLRREAAHLAVLPRRNYV